MITKPHQRSSYDLALLGCGLLAPNEYRLAGLALHRLYRKVLRAARPSEYTCTMVSSPIG